MSYLIKQYKHRFGEKLKPLGFKLYKKTFYRVVNDVIQTIVLLKPPGSCTVEFGIKALASGICDLSAWEGGYSIAHFRKGMHKGWAWGYEPSPTYNINIDGDYQTIVFNGENADAILDEMFSIVVLRVVPILERGINAVAAYKELTNVEKMIYEAMPDGVIMNNYGFVMLCIKANDYEKAYQHMAAIIKQNFGIADIDLYERTIHLITDVQKKKKDMEEYSRFISQFEQAKQERIETLRKLSIPDVQYFQKLVRQNEAISLEYLTHPRKCK